MSALERDDYIAEVARQLDTAPGDEVWEPVTFEVGDRVVWRRNAECEWHNERDHPEALAMIDGTAGAVTVVGDASTWRGGHRYGIEFDMVMPSLWPDGSPSTAFGVWASASELVAIDDEPRAPGEGV